MGKPLRQSDDSVMFSDIGESGRAEARGRDPRAVRRESGLPAVEKSTHAVALDDQSRYQPLSREEEFLFAEMLGLFDYLRKTSAKGYVISLSGGCDSACCAVLVAHMLASAVSELGITKACERLGLGQPRSEVKVADLIKQVLTCIYQRTKNSGPVTHAAASALAQALGATWYDADIQPMVDAYIQSAEKLLQRPLTWAQDDLSLQNIQARARAPLAWLLANVRNSILITTSNRSEAAVGYATMDGDTAGGLAPLAGIDKQFLRHWLNWAETSCQFGLGPIPALDAVNVQQPTAELRPSDSAQKDEDDLMPYAVLERAERYMVRDRLAPDDVLSTLVFDFPTIPRSQLAEFLNKFFKLWARNQWKRERYAPAFHIDDESLDPKTWCRFPILSVPYRVPQGD